MRVRMRLQQLRATRTARWAGSTGLQRFGLQLLGMFSVLAVLLTLPRAEAAAASPAVARSLDMRDLVGHPEDGACEEIEPQELLECGSQYADMLDAPLVVSLLRALDVHLPEAVCDELLADLWAQQVCVAGSIQCGKLDAGAPPGAPPKLGSSSSTGNSNWASSGMGLSAVQPLAYAETTRVFGSRDLQPPVPPPRRSGH
jgi:hypothetical protein